MRRKNFKYVITFVLIGGFFFYILNALWSAFFIHAVPQEKGWCTNWERFETGEDTYETVCLTFKNALEERKYFHNLRMLERNRTWVYATMIAGPLLGCVVFFVIYRWSGRTTKGTDYIAAATLGFVASVVIPLMLSWVLPAPVKWFPDVIVDYAESQVQQALDSLR